MKVEGILFAGLAVFFGISAAAYWVLSREPAGTTALVLSGGPRLHHRVLLALHLAPDRSETRG